MILRSSNNQNCSYIRRMEKNELKQAGDFEEIMDPRNNLAVERTELAGTLMLLLRTITFIVRSKQLAEMKKGKFYYFTTTVFFSLIVFLMSSVITYLLIVD
jgi:uncharacterized membrane protein YidH (DUF202 family)